MCIRAFEKQFPTYKVERKELRNLHLNEVGMIKMVAGENGRKPLLRFYPVYEKMHEERLNRNMKAFTN